MRGGPAEAVYGPMLIGLVFNILLYGTMLAQVYIYFTHFKHDRFWMKALSCPVISPISATNGGIAPGDIPYIQRANWYLAADPVTTGLVGLIVQLFYAWRIHVLIHSWLLVAVVALISLAGGVGATYITYNVAVTPDYSQWGSWDAVDAVWLGCAAASDILITVSLVWYLRHKQRTIFNDSNQTIDRIIRMTMQTGLLTSVIAIINLFVFIFDSTGTHLILNTPLCKLYSNSLLSSLNARGGWKFGSTDGQTCTQGSAIHIQSSSGIRSFAENTAGFISRITANSFSNDPATLRPPEVFVQVESHEMCDNMVPFKAAKIASTTNNDNETDHEVDVSSVKNRSLP
ncbi:hypothetical protein NP233_g6593 [Leucocoprinus birnbaumii]|uniref:DUF6534 domain-containing protein n=1 Tax=Leucocoprinus birnbaumii TaxID=56174 RepID=A0AAD5VT25_9AGAR|nr:hypothetical protein NP233_g6593 [Leucocoprinus birnbaumii]